jgi:hypothetical protein
MLLKLLDNSSVHPEDSAKEEKFPNPHNDLIGLQIQDLVPASLCSCKLPLILC